MKRSPLTIIKTKKRIMGGWKGRDYYGEGRIYN